MASVSIRVFRPDEWRTYRELRTAALRDAPDAFATTLAEALDRSDEEWSSRLPSASEATLPLVAEIADRPVGLAWGMFDPVEAERAHVTQMWVAPEHRGRGVAAALLSTIVHWARARGARVLELAVTCSNMEACRLYESAGFQAVGAREALRPGSDVLVQPMRLDLIPRE